jgi:hypothetical protein
MVNSETTRLFTLIPPFQFSKEAKNKKASPSIENPS